MGKFKVDLESKRETWQVNQAVEAVNLHRHFSLDGKMADGLPATIESEKAWEKVQDKTRKMLRLQQKSYQTEKALLFVYRHVLKKEVGKLEHTLRAKVRRRLPVVLSKEEARWKGCKPRLSKGMRSRIDFQSLWTIFRERRKKSGILT